MKRSILTAAVALAATPALAHHPMGGETPATFMNGLLSGIGHPILGLDHLAFVVAVGIAAALAGSRVLLPFAFIATTVAGTVLHVAAIDLFAVEVIIALSVATIGLLLATGARVSMIVFAALFAVAGLFHGHAYGEAVFGAEATPLLAYLAGFGLTQWIIAVLAGFAVLPGAAAERVRARVAGGMVAGAGLLLIGEQAISATFG